MATTFSLKSTEQSIEIEGGYELESTAAGLLTVPEPNVIPPPGNALKAWLQVLSAFFVFFNTW